MVGPRKTRVYTCPHCKGTKFEIECWLLLEHDEGKETVIDYGYTSQSFVVCLTCGREMTYHDLVGIPEQPPLKRWSPTSKRKKDK